MFMSLLFGLLGLAVITATAAPQRRATGTTIYVYGTDIEGLAIQASSNGTVLVTEDTASDLYNVSVVTADSSTPWAATLTSDNSTLSGYDLYIIPTTDSFAAVGFVSPNATAPSGAVTTGFALFGSNVQYDDGTTYLSMFWARPTNTSDDTWEILWNSSGDSQDGSVPVTLKLTAPSTVDRS